MTSKLATHEIEQTSSFGAALARGLRAGDIVLLEGPLGAGKTVLVRGVVQGLDPAVASLVSSPSYVIANEYPTSPRVIHLDLYRLERSQDVIALGYEEMIYGEDRVTLVEWPALLEPLLEADDPVLRLRLDPSGQDADTRLIRWESTDPRLTQAAEEAAGAISRSSGG